MAADRTEVYLLVPRREGKTWTTRLKRAVIRNGLAGREELIEIAKLLQEKA